MYKSSSETHGQYHKHLLTVSIICEKGSGILTICLYLTCIIFNIKLGKIQEKYILKIPYLNSNFRLTEHKWKKSQVIYIRKNKSTATCIAVNLMPCVPMIPQQVLVISYHGEVCYSKHKRVLQKLCYSKYWNFNLQAYQC